MRVDFSRWTCRFPVKSLPYRSRRTNAIILARLPRISQLICSLLCCVATMLTRPLCAVGGGSARRAGWNQLNRQCVNACHSVPYCNQVWPILTIRLNCMNNIKRKPNNDSPLLGCSSNFTSSPRQIFLHLNFSNSYSQSPRGIPARRRVSLCWDCEPIDYSKSIRAR